MPIEIKNKWYKLQNKEVHLICDNADKILGNELNSILISANKLSEAEREKASFIEKLKLNEYQKLLNPEGQDKMMTLEEFCDNNPNISNDFIFNKLVSLKYVHKYYFTFNAERVHWFAQQKPYTYLSILPKYYADTNDIILHRNIVLSNETVKMLQVECDKYKENI